jgi:replication factor C large subunit
MWVEKYRPTNPNTMIGNEEVRLKFIKWLREWKKKTKPVLLLGPSGVGKTTLVIATAKDLGYEVLELNASDVRTKTKLEERLGPSRLHAPLFEEKLLIFLDEVDGIYGRQDRGGIEFLQDLLKKSKNPLVMAANIEDDKKIIKLAKNSQVLKFKRIPPKMIEMAIKNILRREDTTLDQNTLEMIIRDSKGDMRYAVNSIQSISKGAGEPISETRDTRLGLAEALKLFFEAKSSREAIFALYSCNVQPREKIRAIFQSIIYSNLEVDKMVPILEELSKADEIIAKIGKTQNYRLLRYFDNILGTLFFNKIAGINIRYGQDSLAWNLQLRLWNDRRQISTISLKLAKQHHVSSKDASLIYLPYIALLSKLKNYEPTIISRLRLDEPSLKVFRKETQRVAQEVTKR